VDRSLQAALRRRQAAVASRTADRAERIHDQMGPAWLRRLVVGADDHAQHRARAARRRHPLRPLQLDAWSGHWLDFAVADRPGQKIDVENIREIDLGSATEETSDADRRPEHHRHRLPGSLERSRPELYLFELAQPDETIKEVAESAMRAVVANVDLQGAMGNERGIIEARVAEEMQHILDFYKTGVLIQGVAIRQADPPAAVNDAFKEVTAAQQEAQSYVNQANAYALQLKQKAQGEAGAFDRIYAQYKLAPGVTKRRMYYETMERVLQGVDKTIIEAPGVSSYLPLNELRRAPVKEPAQ
jgi:membrane protease subunit HflK